MNVDRDFLEGKKSALEKLQKAKKEDKIDKIKLINPGPLGKIIDI